MLKLAVYSTIKFAEWQKKYRRKFLSFAIVEETIAPCVEQVSLFSGKNLKILSAYAPNIFSQQAKSAFNLPSAYEFSHSSLFNRIVKS